MSASPPALRTFRARWLRRFPRKALAALDAGQAVAFLDRRVHPWFPDRRTQTLLVAAVASASGLLPFPLGVYTLLAALALGLAYLAAMGWELAWWRSQRAQSNHDKLLGELAAAGVLTQRVLPDRLHRAVVGTGSAAEMAYLLLHPEGQAMLRARGLVQALPAQKSPVEPGRSRL